MRPLLLCACAAALAAAQAFRLESPAFKDGGDIPPRYACDGQNASPALTWTEPPPGTRSLALIMLDNLASRQVVTNWVVYNIPADSRGLASRYKWLSRLKDGTLQGRNSGNRWGYFGPCPGRERRRYYTITLYALDVKLPDKIGYDAGGLAQLMQGHVLAQTRLSATYRRRF